ncbi:hypothetical protein D3C73_1638750 [compost metagenome]
MGIVADSGTDADIADEDISVLVEFQGVDDTLESLPGVFHIFGIQITEAHCLGNSMNV